MYWPRDAAMPHTANSVFYEPKRRSTFGSDLHDFYHG